MIGEVFGQLTVVSIGWVRNGKRLWRCSCACGAERLVPTGALRSGNTKSCGCMRESRFLSHGLSKTRTYRIWRAMLNRCRQAQYEKYYGSLTVCERWSAFENFLSDMGEAPEGLSIDRKDNNKGYAPDNCRWATQTQQVRNTRRRVEYEWNGERHSLIEWAEAKGIPFERLRGRIRYGWSIDDALTRI